MPKNPLNVKIPNVWDEFNKTNNEDKPKYERVNPSDSQRNDVLFKQKGKCAWKDCRINFHRDGITPHFDHIKRVDKGGLTSVENLQALCPSHHSKKTHQENVEKIEKTRQKSKIKKQYTTDIMGNKIKKTNDFNFKF